jgi:hypothetical protein
MNPNDKYKTTKEVTTITSSSSLLRSDDTAKRMKQKSKWWNIQMSDNAALPD